MMMRDPNIAGYVLEREIECVNGDWRFLYDAAPLGYAGLKLECICSEWGETLASSIGSRVACIAPSIPQLLRGWESLMFPIYVHGMKGPQPQKVETIPINSQGKPLPPLAKHELQPHERALSLKLLEQLYPAPKVNND